MVINGIQTVTVVSPHNQKKLPQKPKTSENINIVNVKKNQAGKKTNAPLTLQVDMVNRNTATPQVHDEITEHQQRQSMMNEEMIRGPIPKPTVPARAT